MIIDNSEKRKIINTYIDCYYNLIKKYGITDEQIKTIKEETEKRMSSDRYMSKVDIESDEFLRSIVKVVTGKGLKYDDGIDTYFTGINESFIDRAACSLGRTFEKEKNIKMPESYFNFRNAGELPSVRDSIAIDLDNSAFQFFITSNGEGFYKYLRKNLTDDEIRKIEKYYEDSVDSDNLDYKSLIKKSKKAIDFVETKSESNFEIIDDNISWEDNSMEDTTPSRTEQKIDLLNQKKEVAASIREQIKNSTIDEIRAKKTL